MAFYLICKHLGNVDRFLTILLLLLNTKYYMRFQLAYLHLTLAVSKRTKGQSYVHFNADILQIVILIVTDRV